MRSGRTAVNGALLWARVHRWTPAAAIVLGAATWSIVGHDTNVDRVTVSILPLSLPLLASALAGFGASLALVGAQIPGVVPQRVHWARAAWLLVVIAALVCVVVTAALIGAAVHPADSAMMEDRATIAPMLRNAVLFFGLASAAAIAWGPALAWTAPLVYLVACLQLGGSERDPAWWAMMRETGHAWWQFAIAALLLVLVAIGYVAIPRPMNR